MDSKKVISYFDIYFIDCPPGMLHAFPWANNRIQAMFLLILHNYIIVG